MKLGILTALFRNESLEQMLDTDQGYGMEAVELGTGNYPGDFHCPADRLLEDKGMLRRFQQAIESRGLIISALSCHGNPLHPDKRIAGPFHETWRKTIRLAELLGVERVNVFSGCPGDSDQASYPNWVTCVWPPDYPALLAWQWNEKLIPYWKEEAAFAAEHGIEKIAFEMHPGFMVYNPETLLKLRSAVGPSIGANYDPSHLIWQGIDPVKSIRLLGKQNAIHHVHAKDVYLDPANVRANGVLDTKPYNQVADRSWTFRSVGYGLGELEWKQIVSALRIYGYDYVLSIEHEDILATPKEGLRKAMDVLKNCIFSEPAGEMWWA